MNNYLSTVDSKPLEKYSRNDGIDYISTLPDEILNKILSQMPTKFAFRTKILSPRWKNLSPFEVPPIRLELDEVKFITPTPRNERNSRLFIEFVDKMLHGTLLDGKSLESLYFKWRGNYSYNDMENLERMNEESIEKIVGWLNAALRLNVARLFIYVPFYINDFTDIIHSFNGCASLVELKLAVGGNREDPYVGHADLCVPGEFNLPNLKSFHIYHAGFDESINGLIVGCPKLNELSFRGCTFDDKLYIKSPLLKLLVIKDCTFLGDEVKFDAPSIEVLVYENDNETNTPDWVGADFKDLHSAYISIIGNPNDDFDQDLLRTAKIVKACSRATRLFLRNDSVLAIYAKLVQVSIFPNITWLGIDENDTTGFEVLASFLGNVPTIRTLTFDSFGYFGHDSGMFESLMPTVPDYLEKIEIWHFRGEADEVKLVEYILKNGRGLQEVAFCSCKVTGIFEYWLRTFPKLSKNCQIRVGYDDGELDKIQVARCISSSKLNTEEALANMNERSSSRE